VLDRHGQRPAVPDPGRHALEHRLRTLLDPRHAAITVRQLRLPVKRTGLFARLAKGADHKSGSSRVSGLLRRAARKRTQERVRTAGQVVIAPERGDQQVCQLGVVAVERVSQERDGVVSHGRWVSRGPES